MAITHKVKLGKEVMEFEYPYTLDGRKPGRPTVFPQLYTILTSVESARRSATIRFWILLGAVAGSTAVHYLF